MYLYIFEDGCVGMSKEGPTETDVEFVEDGVLTILDTTTNKNLNQDGEWETVPTSKIEKDDDGNKFHDLPVF